MNFTYLERGGGIVSNSTVSVVMDFREACWAWSEFLFWLTIVLSAIINALPIGHDICHKEISPAWHSVVRDVGSFTRSKKGRGIPYENTLSHVCMCSPDPSHCWREVTVCCTERLSSVQAGLYSVACSQRTVQQLNLHNTMCIVALIQLFWCSHATPGVHGGRRR